MQRWESDFSGGVDEPDVPLPDSLEARVDRFGLLTGVFVLCVGFFSLRFGF